MRKYNVLAEVELNDRTYEVGTTVDLEEEVAAPLMAAGKLEPTDMSQATDIGTNGADVQDGAVTTGGTVAPAATEAELKRSHDLQNARVEPQGGVVHAGEPEHVIGANDGGSTKDPNAPVVPVKEGEDVTGREAPEGKGWMGNHTV